MKYDNDFSYQIKTNPIKLTYKLYTLNQLMSGLKSENNFTYIPKDKTIRTLQINFT